MEMNCVEKEVKKRIEQKFEGRMMTIGRSANLTRAHNGRPRVNIEICVFKDVHLERILAHNP